MRETSTLEGLREHLGGSEPTEQVRRVMRMSSSERLEAMLVKQREILDGEFKKVSASHPDLDLLGKWLIVHKNLKDSDPIYYC